jgi:nucleoside-diphosphate-sugar epimerase
VVHVLVTGGAGFIGSHLVHALVDRGDRVRVFDNFSTGQRRNLAGLESSIEIIEGDLRWKGEIQSAVQGVDLVFHQAAFVSVPESIEKPGECYQINAQGTVEVVEAARKARVKQVVLASSAAVYGDHQDGPLKESLESKPLSPYASSKLFNEHLAGLYTRIFNLPVTALRYFNVFGPRQSPQSEYAAVIPKFIAAMVNGTSPTIYGDGKQTRDFVFVGDVVSANLLAAEKTSAAGGAYNVCSGRETSLLELLDILSETIPGANAPYFRDARLGDIRSSVGDPTLADSVLGFRAQTSLRNGLRYCVEAWKG